MIRVMLIDDEEDALDLLEILLRQLGDVEIAGRYMNPVQALDALEGSAVDAVFLDNQMPGILGTEAARRIRQTMPTMPIIFTTAYSEYAVEAFEIQSTDYLLKPFTIDRLQNAVTRIRQSLPQLTSQANRSGSAEPSPTPVVQCLGGFQIQASEAGKGGVSWKTKKEKELCAYLVHHEGKSANAAAIIEALWPGYDLNKAKTYLYTCLSYLRKTLTEHRVPIRIHKFDQGFMAELEGVTVDVADFERCLTALAPAQDVSAYDRMNQLYQGEYMEACDFGWAVPRQLEIRASYIRALRGWHSSFRGQGRAELAADSLQRILALAPESELDGRELMRLHLEAGDRHEAHRVGRQLEQAVRIQLAAELEEETLQLIRQTTDEAFRGVR
ncbi:response regulator [Cohnella hashimotonis]|uniref:Response regulator n=1 Tax=Cohnella hashimotonis TaxID=2826895 RepID=A0ABT6TM99_9BACL|nr:response regulator [Cohnella hashimotonis]MDI4647962.1 response regulator [Cohnella hashimotonis]